MMKKMKQNIKLKAGKVGVVLAISVIAFLILFAVIYSNTAKAKLKSSINKFALNAQNIIEKVQFPDKLTEVTTDVYFKSNLNLNDTSSDISFKNINQILNTTNLKFDAISDINSDYSNLNFTYNLDNDSSLSASTYVSDNKLYLHLNSIYDRYIVLSDIKDTSILNNLCNAKLKDDYKYLGIKVLKDFEKNITDKYIKVEKTELKVGSDNVKAKKITLLLGQMVKDGVIDNIANDLKNDNESLVALVHILNNPKYATNNDAKTYLDNLVSSIKAKTNQNLTFSIYTKRVIKTKLAYELATSDQDKLLILVQKKNPDFDYKLTLTRANQQAIDISAKQTDDDMYKIKGSLKDLLDFDISGKITNTDLDLDYSLDYNQNNITGKLKNSIYLSSENNSGNGNSNLTINSDKIGSLEINLSTVISSSENIEKPDFSNSIDFNDLTINDIQRIQTNLEYNSVIDKLSDYILADIFR